MAGLLLRDARIWTGVADAPWADSALVQEGRFVFVGRERDLTPPADIETLDAGGRLVVPGFIDGHAHLLGTGLAMRSVDLKGVDSVAEAARRVREKVERTSDGGWVRGAGWDQHLWPGARFPNRGQLDAVAPEHPVALAHTSAHCLWVNSAALRAANLTAATAAPAGGAIDLDEEGEPTGILRDAAMQLVEGAAPALSAEERLAALKATVEHAMAFGITSVHAMDVRAGEWRALRSLHDAHGLDVRVRVFLSATQLDRWLGDARTGAGDDVLRIGGVKFFADGALGSLTAWMTDPYEGTNDTGLALLPPDELEAQVRRSLAHELAPAIHAIGDRANTEVLDILERARELAPELPRRVEHAQLLAADDVPRFAQLGVIASTQPIHATQDIAKVDRHWGERGRNAYPFASLLARGATVAFGSDSPVETMDPLAGIHAAVTRRNARGLPAEGWYPNERVPLSEALSAYTVGCASAIGEADALGRISPGYHADFAVLSGDLFALPDPMRLLDTRVDVTVVGGRVVYRREH